jgi:hypothetical protein
MGDVKLFLTALSGCGMVLVGIGASVGWRIISRAQWKWFWIGAGLWAVAVAIKLVLALALNAAVTSWLKQNLSYPAFIATTGLYIGLLSSACEIGLTIMAAGVWRQLGRDSSRAIAIGVGAGTLEAVLLGAAAIVAVGIAVSGLPGAAETREQLAESTGGIALFWLIGPVERALALLIHASTRALVLLGLAHKKLRLVWAGWAIFTAVDGIAGAAIVLMKTSANFSPPWWIELALAPLALLSVFILRWCFQRWPVLSAAGASAP